MNIQPDNQGAEPERYIRFQFWLSDHGRPILFNHWSDGHFEEADLMLPDRIVDLQHWDTHSGIILNHLVDTGWQTGTMPYGIDPDEPIPAIQSDHETLCEPASQPPLREKALNPAPTPQTLQPTGSSQAPAPSQIQQPETPICILPNPDIAKRSVSPHRTERAVRPFSSISSWFWLLVLISLVCSLRALPHWSRPLSNPTQTEPAALSSSLPESQLPSVPLVRRALPAVPRAVPVLTIDDKPVARAQLVVVRRAQLVRLP